MCRSAVEARWVGAGRRAAVVTRQAGSAAAVASSTPVPSTPYGPTSRISREAVDFAEEGVIESFELWSWLDR
jgi:hypothetical protein